MKNIKRWLTAGLCLLTLGGAVAFAGGAGVKDRQIQQQKRIRHGVVTGELTRPEALRLEKNAVRIHKSVVKDRRDQGVFTPRERVKAQKRLQRQSRAVYRQKHDDDTRR